MAEITKPECVDRVTGKPIEGGLADPRLGPSDNKSVCVTCNSHARDCEGHFGHIELARPCYAHPFTKTVLKILKCVCQHCGHFLFTPRLEAWEKYKKEKKEINDLTDEHQFATIKKHPAASVLNALKIKNPKARLNALTKLVNPRSRCANVLNKKMLDPKTGAFSTPRFRKFDVHEGFWVP